MKHIVYNFLKVEVYTEFTGAILFNLLKRTIDMIIINV